ncbi:type II toxin-antitoxin system CcdA family antitoxin [Neobacillus massiliamazoniensis]|uniref:CopG family transcriptional regulator n=1 Tax=Neobacillus massiliamazoniensis TaxID=1499688 RepID=A0A0U1NZI8_9BACI|nr:type II toxin-antitoxin system CcdA family antitoxin [Neobacillus massiliamazoniensis]CRK83415.1 hypothetical protein BN000_03383 [Neobacillus massiliamazoniensis]
MGRKRLPETKKKININLSITKEIVDQLKEKEVNISAIVEEYLLGYLKMKS